MFSNTEVILFVGCFIGMILIWIFFEKVGAKKIRQDGYGEDSVKMMRFWIVLTVPIVYIKIMETLIPRAL